jgi:hypothetical protein
MKLVAKMPSKNGVLLAMDPNAGVVPDSMAGDAIAATESCVAIGTISEYDGDVAIALSDEGPPATFEGASPRFDGVIRTPSRKVAIVSVDNEAIVEIPVSLPKTRMRIWTNDPSEPDSIAVVVEPSGQSD